MRYSLTLQAEGFNHWILGTADLAEPLAMPTELPYVFTPADSEGRVPFPDVALAARYAWAIDPKNGKPLHDNRGTEYERFDSRAAVVRCSLSPYMYAFYGSQQYVRASETDPNVGTVDTELWRENTTGLLLRQAGIVVTWVDELPVIPAVRSRESSLPKYWDMNGVSYFNTGRITDQTEE